MQRIVHTLQSKPVLLMLSVLFLLIAGYWGWATVQTIQNIEKQPPVPTISTKLKQLNIARWHLFGIHLTNQTDLPLSRLALKLVGTVVGGRGHSSYALIDAQGKAKGYKIGDRLPFNATLLKVLRNEIIINNQGVREKLVLPTNPLRHLARP